MPESNLLEYAATAGSRNSGLAVAAFSLAVVSIPFIQFPFIVGVVAASQKLLGMPWPTPIGVLWVLALGPGLLAVTLGILASRRAGGDAAKGAIVLGGVCTLMNTGFLALMMMED